MDKNTQDLIRRLKERVIILRRKEKTALRQLRKLFRKLKVLSKPYERKAAVKLKKMKAKLRLTQAKSFIKVASEVEKEIKKKVVAKQKVLNQVLSRFEKHFGAQLIKRLHQKAKRLSKGKTRKRATDDISKKSVGSSRKIKRKLRRKKSEK